MKNFTLILILFIAQFIMPQGLGGYALQFPGNTSDYVSFPHKAALDVSAVTIEMWFNWDNITDGTRVDFLIGKATEQLEIHTGGGSGVYGLRFIPTTGLYLDTRANVISPNTWYHVAFCYNPSNSTYKCYVNGTEEALRVTNGVLTTAIITSILPLKLGIRDGLTMPLKGMIDEVRIWNYVRSQAEIQNNKNTTLTGNESGLVAYYRLDEGIGTSITDMTANQVNGTLNGTVSWVTSEAPLPVELSLFTAYHLNSHVQLNWTTLTEVNNSGFEVQRRNADSDIWEKVAFINGSMISNSPKEYFYKDKVSLNGKYVYRLKQVDSDGKFEYSKEILVDVNSTPKQFDLMQNYPNPFNPVTSIRFAVLADSHVKIEVFNAMGELISELVNKPMTAGYHEVNFNGTSLSNGVYYYQLRAGDFSSVKKLILLK